MIDYSKGRYKVLNSAGEHFGVIDGDEFVRSGASLLYRIDDGEVYSLDGQLLGFFENGVARNVNGEVIFTVDVE